LVLVDESSAGVRSQARERIAKRREVILSVNGIPRSFDSAGYGCAQDDRLVSGVRAAREMTS
jgi:hypothetical protein